MAREHGPSSQRSGLAGAFRPSRLLRLAVWRWRIRGRLERMWCAVTGHRTREIVPPGFCASREFSCRCGVTWRQYERPTEAPRG